MNINNNEAVDWGIVENNAQELPPGRFRITEENKGFYTTVVWFLGIIVILSIFSISILDYLGKETPGALIALASVAVGALGSLFSKEK